MNKYSLLSRLGHRNSGQVLIAVLVFMAIGAIVLTPVLNYIGTATIAGRTYQGKAQDYYAADAGVQDALWQISNNRFDAGSGSGIFTLPNYYNQFEFNNPTWGSTVGGQGGYYWPSAVGQFDGSHKALINNENVAVQIKNIWPVQNVPIPTAAVAQSIIQTGKLVVAGQDTGIFDTDARKFQGQITYYPTTGENLNVVTLGAWLPSGFNYFTDSTHGLQLVVNGTGQNFTAVTTATYPFASGTAVVWTLNSQTLFSSMPGVNAGSNPLKLTFTFWQDQPAKIPDIVTWITTSGATASGLGLGNNYSWDADPHVIQIHSVSNSTTVDAVTIHNTQRQLGAAVNGDYFVVGNSLISGDLNPPDNYHYQLQQSSSASIDPTDIPASATIDADYLYWSGWIDWNTFSATAPSDIAVTTVEDGVSFTAAPGPNWTAGSKWTANFNLSSNRVFKGTGGTGTVNNTWYLTSANIDLHTYAGKTVTLQWDQAKGGSPTATEYLYVDFSSDGGTTWSAAPVYTIGGTSLSTSLTTVSAITIPTQYLTSTFQVRFRTNFNATSKIVYLDNIKVVAPYTLFSDDCSVVLPNSTWTQSSAIWTGTGGQYKGVGGGSVGNSGLTLTSSLSLAAYTGQTLSLVFDVPSDTLQAGDYLYVGFSKDGINYDEQMVFSSTTASGTQAPIIIPDAYKTNNFKMRFRISSSSATHSVNLDNIKIALGGASLKYPTNPTESNVTALVNEARVNTVTLNGATVKADQFQVLYPSQFDGTVYAGTWFYTCRADVTALVKQWISNGTIQSNGSGSYTLGNYYIGTTPGAANYRVNADSSSYSFNFASGGGSTGYPLGTPAPSSSPAQRYMASYAGWSLTTLYHSPETAGHQVYLYDIANSDSVIPANSTSSFNFLFGWNNDVDFDHDTKPGGTISGFLAPPAIVTETNSSKITVMVGEGDAGYTGDYFEVNGTALTNDNDAANNVWNGKSSGGESYDGMDIDTFYVNYPIIKPGDTSALINMPTQTDGFTLSFLIISFRSNSVSGGAISYLIH